MGIYLSLLSQFVPPKPKFSVSDIPDLTGKVIIVTGASTGIGKETAKALLQHNAKVYVAARDQARSESAIQDLKTITGKEAVFLKLDLGNLGAVKVAAEEFLRYDFSTHEDVLPDNFLTARRLGWMFSLTMRQCNQLVTKGSLHSCGDLFISGVMFPSVSQLTSDGYDLQFGTNVLGRHYYFTKLLLPLLISTAKTSSDGKARIVTVSSSAHIMGSLKFETFKDTSARKKYSTFNLYSQSKFGNVVFASELDRRYRTEGIVSISLNPGNIRSDLQRHMGSIIRRVMYLGFYDIGHGALTHLYASTSPAAADLGGKYLVPWARIGPSHKDAHDPKVGQALWEWCEEQIKDV
ncbi:hypothetical protein J3R82DRAFT_9748 [Butyriboletus roseoflavus]|nr:hypothetical protein J3R82DRAFT_9748 [Butyriboletus roseoflavus]